MLLMILLSLSFLVNVVSFVKFTYSFPQTQSKVYSRLFMSVNDRLRDEYSKKSSPDVMLAFLDNLRRIKLDDCLGAICGFRNITDLSLLFPGSTLQSRTPTPNRYIIANPITFFENLDFARAFGVDPIAVAEQYNTDQDITILASWLPVIYIADYNPDYGFLGFHLNRHSIKDKVTVGDLFPTLKALRNRPLWPGGPENKGAGFTMIHRNAGFPENRPYKVLPDRQPEFNLYFSPAAAMANELCLTNDAKPQDFKFFQWACTWPPRQLEIESAASKWLVVQASVGLIFADHDDAMPLYKRVVSSLPADQVTFFDRSGNREGVKKSGDAPPSSKGGRRIPNASPFEDLFA